MVATQNPIEQQGTYPLPEAQLDRFLFKQTLRYPTAGGGTRDRRRARRSHRQPDPADWASASSPTARRSSAAAAAIAGIRLVDEVVGYIVGLVRATRETPDLETGASPRSGAMLATAARARAALQGRDYVIPDDVKALALPALRHRVILSPAAEIEGRLADQIIQGLIDRVEAPR